jgi:DegV family protein with EDD domain
MRRIRIITDVTAQLPPELAAQYHITVLPIEIRFGDQVFLLEADKDPGPLYEQMAEGPAKPAQINVPSSALQKAYSKLNREADEILVILSSKQLSNSHATAQSAARAFLGRCRITVMDSMSASKGLGLVVEAAARAAEEGQPLDEIVRLIRGMLPHIYMLFFVERLDYLEQGGRLGSAQTLLGTMLHIKPLLLVEDGEILPLEKVRTQLMALEKLADFVGEFASIRQVYILHGPLLDKDGALIEELKELLNVVLPDWQFPVIEYDPLLACHLGPSGLGVAVYEGI